MKPCLAKIRNSLIGGLSDSFDCAANMAQLTPGAITYFDKTALLRAPRHNGGFTGFMITNIIGSKTRAPLETWNFIQSHPQIYGYKYFFLKIFFKNNDKND